MGISLATGVTASTGYIPPTWPTANTANSLATVNGIISATGAYNQYVPGPVVISASAIKSHVIQAADNNAYIALISINIPPNSVGPDGWLELNVTWGCNSSANLKQCYPVNWVTDPASTDQQTTQVSSTYRMTLANRNNMHVQMVQINNPASSGSSSNPVQALALTMDTTENVLTLWGNVATAGGSDQVWIERYSLVAWNPPVYSTKRLMYGTPMFYGANAHFDDSQSIAQHIADLKTMGMKTLRMAYEYGTSLPVLVQYAQAIQADNTGIQMIVCVDADITSDGSTLWPSEAAAYTYGYTSAVTVVQALAPYGVKLFEAGNEKDQNTQLHNGDPLGGFPSDYSNAVVPIFRGLQRGLIDGIHTVPGCLALSNAYTQCDIGLADMMWNGTQPDGTSGHPLVRWDITNWHNYEDYGSMLGGIPRSFSQGYCNVYEHLNRTYGGVPIIVTEWNAKQSDSDAARAAWAARVMGEAYTHRYKYNIAAICVYELYGTPWNVMTGTPGVVESTFGTTVQSFIAANPDTGL